MANESTSIKIGRIALYSVIPLTWSHAAREACDLAIAKLFERKIAHDQILDTPSRKPDPHKDPPSHLLQEQYEIVPFAHRDTELAEFKDWATEREPNTRVALLTGGPGSGKTRFARELCRQVAGFNDPWLAGFLSADGITNPEHLKPLMSWKGPLLLVVDYAERSEQVATTKALVRAALNARAEREHHQTCILLIARSEGDWWRILYAEFRKDLDNPFDSSRALRRALQPIARPTGIGVQEELTRAFAAFRTRMKQTTDPAPLANAWLPGAKEADALDVHMAGLLAAFGDTPPRATAEVSPEVAIIDDLLAREQQSWHRALDDADLGGMGLKGEPIARLIAWASAVAANADGSTLEVRLSFWPGLREDVQALTRTALCNALIQLYPTIEGGFAGIAPDRLVTFLTRRLSVTDLANAVTDLPTEAVSGLLRHLTWHAQRYGDKETNQKIRTVVLSSGTAGVLVAFEVAAAEGDPLGMIAAAVVSESRDRAAAAEIYERRPSKTFNLREIVAAATSVLRDSAEDNASRAQFAHSLSSWLHELGQRENALEAAEEAVTIRRALAETEPDIYRRYLASSLDALANRFSDIGSHNAALEAAQESVEIRRELCAAQPAAPQSGLASSLNTLANRLSDMGYRQAALEAAKESVKIRRELAKTEPDSAQSSLASALNTLSNRLSDLGYYQHALEAAKETSDMYRTLARAKPDAYIPDFARSLNNLAVRLIALELHEIALDPAREATELFRDFANRRPEAFRVDFATSLVVLALVLTAVKRTCEALVACQDAIVTLRDLYLEVPRAFRPLMWGMIDLYAKLCDQLDKAPDTTLLAPLIEALPGEDGVMPPLHPSICDR